MVEGLAGAGGWGGVSRWLGAGARPPHSPRGIAAVGGPCRLPARGLGVSGGGPEPPSLMPPAARPWTYLAQDDSKGKHVHLLVVAAAWVERLAVSRRGRLRDQAAGAKRRR